MLLNGDEVNIIKCNWNYRVVIDPTAIDDVFGNISPFNLAQDLKGFRHNFVKSLSEEIAALIKIGPHGKSFVEISYEYLNKKKIAISKFRIADKEKCQGKSGALRCIAIVDNLNHICIVLHIYEKRKKENISKKSENRLKEMLKSYVDSLK